MLNAAPEHRKARGGVRLQASVVFFIASLIASSPVRAQTTDDRYDFDVEGGELGPAMEKFQHATGAQLLFSNELAGTEGVNPLRGRHTISEALDIMLRDTGLTSGLTESGMIVITRANNREGEMANGKIKKTLLASVATFLFGAGAHAQDVETVDDPEGGEQSEQEKDVIVVTGTNIRGVNNPTTPVISFDRETLELSGIATLQEFPRIIPQNYNGSTSVESSIGDNPFSASNGTHGTGFDLRGLGAGSTLTLLNGRRLMASGTLGNFVDISTLPLAAIDRVEILTDGASAIYGSDAVGGVVNFILRDDYEGIEARARVASVTEGDKLDYQFGATAGDSWGSGGAFANLTYSKNDPLLAVDRDFATIGDSNPNATILPKEDTISVLASFHQDIGSNTTIRSDGLFSSRDVFSSIFSNDELRSSDELNAYILNTSLQHRFGDDWSGDLFIDFGREDIEGTQGRASSTSETFSKYRKGLLNIESRFSGPLFELPGGVVSTAFGGAFRRESYKRFDTGLDFDRDVFAAYGELLIPLVGEDMNAPGFRRFDLSVAGRYEDYSDFGSTFNPKIGVHWEPMGGLSLRATYAESFRAPRLTALLGQQQYGFFAISDPELDPAEQDPRLPAGAALIFFRAGANPNLTEETAKSWTGGFTLEPASMPGFIIEGSYFDVTYKDRIENIGVVRNPVGFEEFIDRTPDVAFIQDIIDRQDEGEFVFDNFLPFFGSDPSLLMPDPNDVQLFVNGGLQNIGLRHVNGFDLTSRYEFDVGASRFAASLNASYIFNYESQATETSTTIDSVDKVYRPIDLTMRGTLSWTRGAFTAFTAVNYADSYIDDFNDDSPVKIEAWTTVDLTLSYDTARTGTRSLLSNTRLSLSVRNLLDNGPPFINSSNAFEPSNYDTANASPLGRYIAFNINKRF